MTPIDYYIYYRIDPHREAALRAAVASMQASLRAATGVAGRLRRRLDDPSTWMEVYEGVTDPRRFEIELGLHVLRHGLVEYLKQDGVRHLERFRVA
ncbi:DUF4936 family protein [Methyloversatilis thermotolerans]|uniref:DUF4936 family protein n=1 Tax=Methyloversatilis thermotolerans TaxID=1346290 RepID=UPI000372BE1B|nr:DUF4936 family protein [Methyloversatilis thermotolerans]